jgi:hypothetical protein
MPSRPRSLLMLRNDHLDLLELAGVPAHTGVLK